MQTVVITRLVWEGETMGTERTILYTGPWGLRGSLSLTPSSAFINFPSKSAVMPPLLLSFVGLCACVSKHNLQHLLTFQMSSTVPCPSISPSGHFLAVGGDVDSDPGSHLYNSGICQTLKLELSESFYPESNHVGHSLPGTGHLRVFKAKSLVTGICVSKPGQTQS